MDRYLDHLVPDSLTLPNLAATALRAITGLHVRKPVSSSEKHGHLLIQMDGQSHKLRYEIQANVDRRDRLINFKVRHHGAVLITRSLSTMLAEQCRKLEIQFIDTAGNCYLRQQGLYVYVSGMKEAAKAESTERGLTPAALRLVFAILTRPGILNSNVRKIGEVASISHGAASAALITLEERGFLGNSDSGRKILLRPERWLDTWTEGYLGRIRPKLEKIRMSASLPLAAVIDRFSPAMREVVLGGQAAAMAKKLALGGEAAAAKHGLKPGTLTLYANLLDQNVLRDIVQEYKLRRDSNGPIEIVNMFWNTMELESFPTVPDPLIYADLIGIGDARTMEIAEVLRKEICFDVQSKA